jgi:putative PIN family toxin of toxin-antitoxin system
LIAELADVIARDKFHAALVRSRTNPARMLAELRRLAEMVDPTNPPAPISRDPDDDIVLALAADAGADLIVSGDADLLILASHAGIPIVTPADALAIVTAVRP